jgi:hypothetical protein
MQNDTKCFKPTENVPNFISAGVEIISFEPGSVGGRNQPEK